MYDVLDIPCLLELIPHNITRPQLACFSDMRSKTPELSSSTLMQSFIYRHGYQMLARHGYTGSPKHRCKKR